MDNITLGDVLTFTPFFILFFIPRFNLLKSLTTNFANFSGRSSRQELWGLLLIPISLGFSSGLAGIMIWENDPSPLVGFLILIVYFSIVTRRIHDIGYSGRYYLLAFILLYVAGRFSHHNILPPTWYDFFYWNTFGYMTAVSCFLCFKKGMKGSNRFGPDPLENNEVLENIKNEDKKSD